MVANAFNVVTYNILAKSLGTNTIPWLMSVSPEIRSRVEEHTRIKFEEFVNRRLYPEYMEHFHKNFQSGDYSRMRSFWGVRQCKGPEDIPPELVGLSWAKNDVVSYQKDDSDEVLATTLRGILEKSLPPDLFHDFFAEVISKEESIYCWETRGPRVFEAATRGAPDVLALQEYDCHSVTAEYRAKRCTDTFADAMMIKGYDGAFLKDPLLGRNPPSGIGIFWRRNVFEPISQNEEGQGPMEVVDCGSQAFGGAVVNFDLLEKWHPNGNDLNSDCELMPAKDRRNAAVFYLRHRLTGKSVLFCAAHLMTTSRDGAKTNLYPGEVRACEIKAVRSFVEPRARSDDHVIVLGDFNTDAKDCESVLGGRIPSSNNKANLEIDTGFRDGIFSWSNHRLTEAFRKIHKWGDGVCENKNCSSRNVNRIEWIDYCFHSENLQPIQLSDCATPPGQMPDEIRPSDHMPLAVTFEFV